MHLEQLRARAKSEGTRFPKKALLLIDLTESAERKLIYSYGTVSKGLEKVAALTAYAAHLRLPIFAANSQDMRFPHLDELTCPLITSVAGESVVTVRKTDYSIFNRGATINDKSISFEQILYDLGISQLIMAGSDVEETIRDTPITIRALTSEEILFRSSLKDDDGKIKKTLELFREANRYCGTLMGLFEQMV